MGFIDGEQVIPLARRFGKSEYGRYLEGLPEHGL